MFAGLLLSCPFFIPLLIRRINAKWIWMNEWMDNESEGSLSIGVVRSFFLNEDRENVPKMFSTTGATTRLPWSLSLSLAHIPTILFQLQKFTLNVDSCTISASSVSFNGTLVKLLEKNVIRRRWSFVTLDFREKQKNAQFLMVPARVVGSCFCVEILPIGNVSSPQNVIEALDIVRRARSHKTVGRRNLRIVRVTLMWLLSLFVISWPSNRFSILLRRLRFLMFFLLCITWLWIINLVFYMCDSVSRFSVQEITDCIILYVIRRKSKSRSLNRLLTAQRPFDGHRSFFRDWRRSKCWILLNFSAICIFYSISVSFAFFT